VSRRRRSNAKEHAIAVLILVAFAAFTLPLAILAGASL